MYMSAVVYILAYGVARQTRNCSYTISFPLFSSRESPRLWKIEIGSLTEYQGVGCLAWLSFSFATCYWCICQTAAPVLRRPCAVLAFEPRTLLLNIFFFFFGEQKEITDKVCFICDVVLQPYNMPCYCCGSQLYVHAYTRTMRILREHYFRQWSTSVSSAF